MRRRRGRSHLQPLCDLLTPETEAVFLQLPGDLQREGERPAEEEVHSDLQPEGPRAPKGGAVRGG